MDITCAVCKEPWDFHYVMLDMDEEDPKEGTPWSVLLRYGKGCPCCKGKAEDETEEEKNCRLNHQAIASACADLLGDDVDGYAAMMEDAEYLGFLD